MNQIKLIILSFMVLISLPGCHEKEKVKEEYSLEVKGNAVKDSTANEPGLVEAPVPHKEKKNIYESVPDTGFVDMNRYASDFFYDMKYATEDNFLNKAVYSCNKCLLRKEVADALNEANKAFMRRGLRLKFYDCYRPLAVQKKMWELNPNPIYLANPYTHGSIHNRGGAVDITLVDPEGRELDMGTGFDHFGREAHHAYTNLPDTILSNRRYLKETMKAYGFHSITSEWWHYYFKGAKNYAVSDFTVECD